MLQASLRAQQQVIGAPPEASNMRLVGCNDLQARSAYQPTIHHQGDRWIAYIGHHGGTDDVPEAGQSADRQGRAQRHLDRRRHRSRATRNICVTFPGQAGNYEAGGAQMVRVCDGKTLPKGDRNAVYMLRTFGGEAHEIWNVADPANPVLITRIGGLKDTHKNWWECDTGIAFLVSGAPDWRTRRMTQVYDLSDPAKPREDPRFRPARPGAGRDRRGADRTARADLDRAAGQPRLFRLRHQQGRRPADRRSREAAQWPEGADAGQSALSGNLRGSTMSPFNGAHTTFPMLHMPIAEFAKDKDGKTRDIVMIVDEAILNECQRAAADGVVRRRHGREPADDGVELHGAGGERHRSASAAGGSARIPPTRAWRRSYYKKMAFIAFFNAGVRALDIRDPYQPEGGRLFHPGDHGRRPTSAASRSTARTAARSRSRPTMSRPTSAATSTSSTAPIPACTSWS